MSKTSLSVPPDFPIPAYCAKPDFPFLVSFPRTGSHWLRMMMEAYFGEPSLTQVFFTKEPTDFTCYHVHDLDLTFSPPNVIYLTRDPVDTLYSQIKYEGHSIEEEDAIWYWAGQYHVNLSKWLRTENFTTRKTIITYEEMREDIGAVIGKICHHLKKPLVDGTKVEEASRFVSKEKVSELVDNSQVITTGTTYENDRKEFRMRYGAEIIKYFSDFPEVIPRPSQLR